MIDTKMRLMTHATLVTRSVSILARNLDRGIIAHYSKALSIAVFIKSLYGSSSLNKVQFFGCKLLRLVVISELFQPTSFRRLSLCLSFQALYWHCFLSRILSPRSFFEVFCFVQIQNSALLFNVEVGSRANFYRYLFRCPSILSILCTIFSSR